MTEDIHSAETVLLDAGDIIRARLKEHGHTEQSFRLIAELWTRYLVHAFSLRGEQVLYPHDIAYMMSLTKTARSVYGKAGENGKDIAGYGALAAMLQARHEETQKQEGK